MSSTLQNPKMATQTFYLNGEPVPSEVVVTGRLEMALAEPHKKTLPPSCALLVWQNNLAEHLVTISRYLSFGAGVKVILDGFEKQPPVRERNLFSRLFNRSPYRKRIDWGFYLNPDHLDFEFMTDAQKLYYRDLKWQDFLGSIKIIHVADSMRESHMDWEGTFYYSIEDSWVEFIKAATEGKRIWLDLSELRESGRDNGKGLISTGPLGTHKDVPIDEIGNDSFLSVYKYIADFLETGDIIRLMHLLGQMCRVIKRGGYHKTGIVTHSLDWRHPDIKQYLAYPLERLPGSQKKGVRLTPDIVDYPGMIDLIVDAVNKQSVFLEKEQPGGLYPNVCEGILLRDRGACLLAYANLGKCRTPEDITRAYLEATKFVCVMHNQWRDMNPNTSHIYRPIGEDRQVGVGWMGLANLLAAADVKYKEFILALKAVVLGLPWPLDGEYHKQLPYLIAKAMEKGYEQAAIVARHYDLERFTTIEPNQRCWVDERNNDLRGFVCCRNIDPPYARREKRDSEVLKTQWYDHGPNIETMADVTHAERLEMWEYLQILSDRATGGMTHAMSFDHTKWLTAEDLIDFIVRSPLKTTYYQMANKVDQSYLNKGLLMADFDEDDDFDVDEEPTDKGIHPGGCPVCGGE